MRLYVCSASGPNCLKHYGRWDESYEEASERTGLPVYRIESDDFLMPDGTVKTTIPGLGPYLP